MLVKKSVKPPQPLRQAKTIQPTAEAHPKRLKVPKATRINGFISGTSSSFRKGTIPYTHITIVPIDSIQPIIILNYIKNKILIYISVVL